MRKVAIIGGGITGLSAAYYLQKAAHEQQLPVSFGLYEASTRLGGKVETARHDGFIIERGADSFLARKPEMRELAQELGLGKLLVHNATGPAFIYKAGRLHPIPDGSVMGVPTDREALMASDLFSEAGKARALEDLKIERSTSGQDVSLGEFFRRRLGDELVDNLVEPLLSGVYGGALDEMSLFATYPQFYEAEQRYGSLIRGLRARKEAAEAQLPAKADRRGAFYNFTTGMETLVEALKAALPAGSLHLSTAVQAFTRSEAGYELQLSSGEAAFADAVIFALPHQLTAALLREEQVMEPFADLPSTSVVTISMAFNQADVPETIDGTGFLLSRQEKDFSITACTWISKKWPHSTPDGKAVLRAFLGKPGDDAYVDLSDEEITQLALTDLQRIMRVAATPEFVEITRIKDGMPHYRVGHQARLTQVRAAIADKLPGVALAGLSYDGIGLSDCVRSGRTAAEQALNFVNSME